MTWATPEARDEIADMLHKGLSASQIAAHFEGVTRNAVIGIVTRDKRLKEIGFRNRAGPQNIDRVRRSRNRSVHRPAFTAASVVAELGPITPFGSPQTAGIPLMLFNGRRCKWCINDPEPRTNAHLFCGETTNGGSYCAYHATAAVGAGTESERSASRVLARAA